MTKSERFLIAEYRNIKISLKDAVKVRGFFADLDATDTIMHNHLETGQNIYRYPKVQYKVIHHHPCILAFGKGIDSLYPKLMRTDHVRLGNITYERPDLHIGLETRLVGDSDTIQTYRFLTPWLALNQQNYRKYQEETSDSANQELLKRILVGNVLSMCSGFDVTIEGTIRVVLDVKSIPVRFKGEPMIGFTGGFTANVNIPSLCGLGKGVSRGMGTVVKC